jgi:hypothetical protein
METFMIQASNGADYVVYVDHTSSGCRAIVSEGTARADTLYAQLGQPVWIGTILPILQNAKSTKCELSLLLDEADARFGRMLQRLAH